MPLLPVGLQFSVREPVTQHAVGPGPREGAQERDDHDGRPAPISATIGPGHATGQRPSHAEGRATRQVAHAACRAFSAAGRAAWPSGPRRPSRLNGQDRQRRRSAPRVLMMPYMWKASNRNISWMRNQETTSDSTMTEPNAAPIRKYGRSMKRITAAPAEAPGTFPPDRPRRTRTPPARMRAGDRPCL